MQIRYCSGVGIFVADKGGQPTRVASVIMLFGGGLHTDPRQLCLVALVAPLSCTVPFLMPTMCSFLSFDVAMRWASIEHDELVVGLRPNRLARLAGWALIEHDSWDAAWQRIVIGAVRLASSMVRAEGDGQAWRTARWPVCEKRRAAVGAGGAVIAASRLAFTPLLEIATCAECHKLSTAKIANAPPMRRAAADAHGCKHRAVSGASISIMDRVKSHA